MTILEVVGSLTVRNAALEEALGKAQQELQALKAAPAPAPGPTLVPSSE